MSGTTVPPLIITAAGPVPTPPATLNAALIALATSYAPGLTVLPAGLVDDMTSTATGALVVADQARVDLIASVSPYSANPYILNQLGQIYGVPQGQDTNTGVYVVFSGTGIIGYIIQAGFTVSDGTYQYVIQDAGIISASGMSQPLLAIATQPGSWAVPANTVNQLATSIPSIILNPSTGSGLSVTNPLQGTPSPGAQTEADYRVQVLQAGLVATTGTPALLKTYLGNVAGVIDAQVSIRQQTGGGWEIIVGGVGDPYQIGLAIYQAIPDISTLKGSVLVVSGITNANPAVVTTNLNHGYMSGQIVQINGALGITGINGANLTATVLSATSFSIGVNTTTSGTYTGGGVVTPNFRNVSVNLYDYPDTYTIPYVLPPAQSVTMVVIWNTSSTGFVSAVAIAGAAQPALVAYINALPVGQPINQFELTATFQAAVAPIVPLALLTRLVFSVSINGVGVAPATGTGIIAGDPESYFTTTAAGVVINQG
jgi:hypothetical protein